MLRPHIIPLSICGLHFKFLLNARTSLLTQHNIDDSGRHRDGEGLCRLRLSQATSNAASCLLGSTS